jgi:hypothetical protein
VLAEFMVMWRWENMLLNKFSDWILKIFQVMCCYQISMLLLIRGISEDVEWQRKERGVKKQQGPTWIEKNNEVCTFVVEDQDHPQMIEIHLELNRVSVSHALCGVSLVSP